MFFGDCVVGAAVVVDLDVLAIVVVASVDEVVIGVVTVVNCFVILGLPVVPVIIPSNVEHL